MPTIATRRAGRRTDDQTPGKPRVEIVTEPLSHPIPPFFVLIKVHTVSPNYRDASIANGGNPWPKCVAKLPADLPWEEACVIPCAGVTAWSALKGLTIGQSVLIQGTGGVALKLAQIAGFRVILTSSSDENLRNIVDQLSRGRPVATVNYATNPDWHEEVLRLIEGVGVDLALENGGPGTLVKSLRCTRRGSTISQVGYLSNATAWSGLPEFLSTLVDRKVVLRGINAGLRVDLEDPVAALEATRLRSDDIIDSVFPFDEADTTLQHLWEGKQVGKLVIKI